MNCYILVSFTAGQCQASDNYVDQLEDYLKHSCSPRVAGFFAEYIQVKPVMPLYVK